MPAAVTQIINLLKGGIVALGLYYTIAGAMDIFRSRIRQGGGGGDGSEVVKLVLGIMLVVLGLSPIIDGIVNLIKI